MNHAFLYRRHQLALDGPGRAALLWLRINAMVQPSIRIPEQPSAEQIRRVVDNTFVIA